MDFIYNFVTQNNVIISGLILLIAYIFIAIEKIPKVTIALLGGALTLFLGLLSTTKAASGGINPHYFINFIDFNVIFLLVGMMIIVNISAKSGMFTWVANNLLKLTKGQPIKVFVTLAVFTAFASAFLDNVTTVILMLPITFVVAEELDINPIPFLITEILASNIGGTATLIGDPPNIIIGSAANLSFMAFLRELTDIVVLILFVSIAILWFIFRKSLTTTKENMAKVANLDNSKTITNYPLMIRASIVLFLVILSFILHDMTHIAVATTAMLGASFLLIFEKPSKIIENIEWTTIFFFIGLFIIIGGLEASGGIELMAKWLLNVTHGSQELTAMIIIWASGILSGIIDNIPYTATMTPLLLEVQNIMGVEYTHPLWWCLSLGACLGGNLTIIGAAANVIVSESAAKHGYKLSFMSFLKYGVLITFVSLTLSSIYIHFRFMV